MKKSTIQLGLLGASGRMGQQITQLLKTEFPKLKLTSAVGKGDDLHPLYTSDLVIDFSLPEALEKFLTTALTLRTKKLPPLVTGTTGYGEKIEKLLNRYAKKGMVLSSLNFSVGINALLFCLEEISPSLFNHGFVVSLTETHHIHKKDSPSGTALTLQRKIASHSQQKIPITSHRLGEEVGDHSVEFRHALEVLTFRHQALDRSVFARGALQVGIWLQEQQKKRRSGRLTMADYLKGKRRSAKK